MARSYTLYYGRSDGRGGLEWRWQEGFRTAAQAWKWHRLNARGSQAYVKEDR